MAAHVNFEGTWSHKLIVAHLTDVRPLSRVPSFMISQMTLCCEAHITISELTLEGFLPIMNTHVSE